MTRLVWLSSRRIICREFSGLSSDSIDEATDFVHNSIQHQDPLMKSILKIGVVVLALFLQVPRSSRILLRIEKLRDLRKFVVGIAAVRILERLERGHS